MEELFAKLFSFVLWKCMGVGIVVAVDKFVVQRRDAIVRRVRQLQAILNIPPCLSVVGDTAPGVTDESLRFGAEMTAFLGLASLGIFGVVAVLGKVKSLWGFITGIVVPVCVMTMIWIYFISARRRFDQGERDTYAEGTGENQGLRRSINSVLQDPGCI
ncbi:hypothetical protein F4779DRAFT_636653 [Xylariaceae sp. FL0662B]|nr:hypothetical protein F4779DRAFT_636653 [Xylariaceae sp. FL0662B]